MTAPEAVSVVKDGDTVMIGGFGPKGYPGRTVRALLKTSEARDLLFIANGPHPFYLPALEKLLERRARGMIATYVRRSAIAEKLFEENRLELVPQGTFAERIRAGGAGIPAFFTHVGVGTQVEEGKEKLEIDGLTCIMEKALTADVALIRASVADTDGNCYMRACTKTFGVLMPAAAKYSVVEAEQIVPVGQLDPELVCVPGILIDAIVKAGA